MEGHGPHSSDGGAPERLWRGRWRARDCDGRLDRSSLVDDRHNDDLRLDGWGIRGKRRDDRVPRFGLDELRSRVCREKHRSAKGRRGGGRGMKPYSILAHGGKCNVARSASHEQPAHSARPVQARDRAVGRGARLVRIEQAVRRGCVEHHGNARAWGNRRDA